MGVQCDYIQDWKFDIALDKDILDFLLTKY